MRQNGECVLLCTAFKTGWPNWCFLNLNLHDWKKSEAFDHRTDGCISLENGIRCIEILYLVENLVHIPNSYEIFEFFLLSFVVGWNIWNLNGMVQIASNAFQYTYISPSKHFCVLYCEAKGTGENVLLFLYVLSLFLSHPLVQYYERNDIEKLIIFLNSSSRDKFIFVVFCQL